ncbi:hypothetical protein ACQCN2_12870 [Brevibacillus ginsengisoli]|uniref:hypothetical protein n=1 Tax=Brevibacillus ginsengisoli TaxID=363854 RepID=UPI003CF13680
MRLPSLYSFYRVHFGYPKSDKKHFALAIRDTYPVLSEAFKKHRELSVIEYKEREYARQLTVGFLNMFNHLAYSNYELPFEALSYEMNSISISKDLLLSSKRLDIDFYYLYDVKNRKIIFLEFGKLDEVRYWFQVFKTLISNFKLAFGIPNIDTIVCWDLLRGTIYETSYSPVEEANYTKVLETAKRIVST